ncbi:MULTISPECIES: hypothetical protein [Streptomyces]|uniref:Tat pathway signal sequence domain protein n=1 Tax=Streptomyces dengpaensis TaxID=2049881 RepID=A0ABN5I3L4_9ACTN|nr:MULTISPECIES: hypothetical protein [Streptomyces]AVH57581.1 hypothetical protein C4B68_19455 [Streptomyces dengpaensis]PIB07916.1 hypothetical protein B1C81_18330 [Streptomyces sp. HG99]
MLVCALLLASLPVAPAAGAPTAPAPAAPAVPDGATGGHSLVRDALPEFLGSLGAGVLLALAAAAIRQSRARRARREDGSRE